MAIPDQRASEPAPAPPVPARQNPERPVFDGLSEEQMLRIDRVCAQFESACQADSCARLEAVLTGIAGEDRLAALYELIPIEMEYRLKRGDRPQLKEYAQRFPELSSAWLEETLDLSVRRTGNPAEQDAADELHPAGKQLKSAKPVTSKNAAPPTHRATRTSPDNFGNRRMGDYRIIEHLGGGGMGTVYRAVHEQMGRVVALKVLRPEVQQDPLLLKRFEREVRTAALLKHPNIVTAFDAREFDGQHFLIMELVDGPDLETLVRQKGPLKVAEAIGVLTQTARGLDYAHKKGVVHRDIKPANLLRDSNGTVRILDMGLARLTESETQHNDIPLTHTGMLMGTAMYMAPEQARNTRKADARSDIYSLGCTLYFLLNARPVYAGESLMEMLVAHCTQPIPPLGATRQDIPQSLNRIFRKMVAKKPRSRFQSAAELLSVLEASATGEKLSDGGGRKRRSQRRKNAKPGLSARFANLPAVLAKRMSARHFYLDRIRWLKTRQGAVFVSCIAFLLVAAVIVRQQMAKSEHSAIITEEIGGNGRPVAETVPATDRYELAFNGRSGYVSLPALELRVGEVCTMEAIVRPRGFRTSNLISWMGPDWMALYLSFEGRWGMARRLGEHTYLVTMNEQTRLNERVHVAGVFNGASLSLFVNGVPVSTVAGQISLPVTTGGLYIGGVPQGLLPADQSDRFFDGTISAVRLTRGVRYTRPFEPPAVLPADEQTISSMTFEEGEGQVTVSRGLALIPGQKQTASPGGKSSITLTSTTATIVDAEWIDSTND